MSLIQSLPAGPLDIVGDIHGEFDALQALLQHLGYNAHGQHQDGRTLVFVGDFCDRGPDSPAVLALVQQLLEADMSLGGTVVQVRNLAECMQVAFDAGAKRILLPTSSVIDIATVPGELFAKFQTSFYSDPVDAVFKALGVE